MALTLIEAAKLHSGDVVRSTIIEYYARSSDILRVLPFEDIQGGAYKYVQEKTLPGIGFRKINGSYTESTGILNPETEPLVVAGGDLDVDKAILKMNGEDQRSVHELMKVKALALNWTKTFLKGDSTTTEEEFDGMQMRLSGNQLIANSTSSGGAALSLAKLDELIDAVQEPTHLVMNKTMRRLLTVAARTTTVGGNILWVKDEFGRQLALYNDLPILIADEDNTGSQILPFTEAPYTGSSVCTSIHCISIREDGVKGIQNGVMEVNDLGELQTKPCKRTRVEWLCGVCILHPKAAARLYSITNGTVTT